MTLRASLAALLLLSLPAAAQAPPFTAEQMRTAERLIAKGLSDTLAYEVTESLTTEIGPRLAGTEADARALEWGAAKLKALGFRNVRIEPFEMPFWSRVVERAEIVAPFPQPLAIAALGNSPATPEGGVEGEIVRFETMKALETAPLTGLEGKIVFVDERMTRTQDGSGYGAAVVKRSAASREAAKRGAAAALIRSVGTDTHRAPHTGTMSIAAGQANAPAAALSNADADQLARALRLAGRRPVTARVEIGVEARPKAVSGNVIGEIPGRTDEMIVIGGHIDSWDLGTGAIDDAAGIGITVAAAKLIDALPGKPKRTIRVVLWGAEEVGLHGARAYAERHKDALAKHFFASESDFGAGRIWQFQSRFGEDGAPVAQAIADALRPLGVNRGDNNASGGPDVGPLRAAGVPVATLRQNGWDYFDLHHTAEDTLDKIAIDDLRQNVAAWAAMIYLISETDRDLRAPSNAAGG